jgi:poly(A) polymerase
MTEYLEKLYNAGFSAYLHGFSAIDSWLASRNIANIQILTNAGTTDLAKLFENLRYPGVEIADAALDDDGNTIYFQCADFIDDTRSIFDNNRPSFKILDFYQDCKTRVFYDPHGVYPLLKELRKGKANPLDILHNSINLNSERSHALIDASLLLAKYFSPESEAEKQINKIASLFTGIRGDDANEAGFPVCQEKQRLLLTELMTSSNPALGLELLKVSGFIGEYWPELSALDEADHSKDFHPEGNVWKHTMETFRYRKNGYGHENLLLSLSLLLHDTGKPLAQTEGSKRFNGHAQLGEGLAHLFLGRLGFDAALITDVCFLVRHHMLPAALPRLPLFRTAEIMSSALFPVLMELYRCDESSSFKGLDGYYESSAAYQSFLRNKRNPYRAEDGKKLNRKKLNRHARH